MAGHVVLVHSVEVRILRGQLMKPTEVRLARMKGTLALKGSQPFKESLNVPRYSVQIPALLCTATGYGEQTISKTRR